MPSKSKKTSQKVKRNARSARKSSVKKATVKKSKISKVAPKKRKVKNIFPEPKINPNQFTGKKKKFYDLLMNMRNTLLGQVQALSEEALNSGASSGEHSSAMTEHLADYGSDNFTHNMQLDIMTGEMEDIEMIDEALERLASGEYGKCLDCGCTIPEERLLAKPHARFCVKCKAEREKNASKIEFER